MAVDWVWTMFERAWTLTFSATEPASSMTFRSAGVAVAMRTSAMTAVLNPGSEKVAVYVPGSSAATENSPALLVTTGGRLMPVALFLTTTVTPGTTASCWSITTPDREAVAAPFWAAATRHTSPHRTTAMSSRWEQRLILGSGIGKEHRLD